MSNQDIAGRFVGIRHRTKRTADGEARPTEVAVVDGDNVPAYTLPDEQAELDWVLGRFPRSWRTPKEDEDFSSFFPHHLKTRALKRDEDAGGFPQNLLRQEGSRWLLVTKVPASYDGLKSGDIVTLVMGGSGDRLACALSRKAEEVSSVVLRVPPFILKEARGDREKSEDALTLAEIGRDAPELAHETYVREREVILLRERYRVWRDTQKDRIRCEQRLRQRFIGKVFCAPDGLYPQGALEDLFDAEKANSTILQALVQEEAAREAEMAEALKALPVWKEILADVEGMGVAIASRLVSAIGDVRRFATDAKLKAYCGVHVLGDGSFPRKRSGEVANWSDVARQASWLFGEQLNYRSNSHWGIKMREYKKNFRAKHPHPVVSRKKLTPLYRRLERFLLSVGIFPETEGLEVDSPDVLFSILEHGIARMPNGVADEHRDEIEDLQLQIDNLPQSSGGKRATMYTASHIHRMGIWRALSRFTRWFWREWTKLERRAHQQEKRSVA